MDELAELWQRPVAKEMYTIAGWRQWADAGAVSSALPAYLVGKMGAAKIGQIKADEFYLFQVPGTHHLLRPKIALEEGRRKKLEPRRNEFFYADREGKGLLLFVGEEPHRNVERYADAFFDIVEELGVQRVVAVGGVHGPVPYDKERQVSCVYSLPGMKEGLAGYAVRFSNYRGGASIGTYLAHRAEQREIEFLTLYALVPSYDFERLSIRFTGIKIEMDFKAWYDLMRRVNHMFGLRIDLSELERQSKALVTLIESQIDELDRKAPQLKIKEHIEQATRDFEEVHFVPLDDVWKRELRDLFED